MQCLDCHHPGAIPSSCWLSAPFSDGRKSTWKCRCWLWSGMSASSRTHASSSWTCRTSDTCLWSSKMFQCPGRTHSLPSSSVLLKGAGLCGRVALFCLIRRECRTTYRSSTSARRYAHLSCWLECCSACWIDPPCSHLLRSDESPSLPCVFYRQPTCSPSSQTLPSRSG